MSVPDPPLTLGVEEEYQIIDPNSRNLHSYISEFLSQDEERPKMLNLRPELMQSQVEVGSRVCKNVKEVRQEVIRLRREVFSMAKQNDLLIAAASTHPFARWEDHVERIAGPSHDGHPCHPSKPRRLEDRQVSP